MLTEWLHKWSEWEHAGVGAAGVPISLLRFALAFFASVPVGILFKYVPTVKGTVYHLLDALRAVCPSSRVGSTRPWSDAVLAGQRP